MSQWSEIAATISIDTKKEFKITTQGKKEMLKYVNSFIKKAPKITGSEMDADVFVNIKSDFNIIDVDGTELTTQAVITVYGLLRDRDIYRTNEEWVQFITYLQSMVDVGFISVNIR